MGFIFTLLSRIAFPAPPTPAGWLVCFFFLGMLIYALNGWRQHQPVWDKREWGIFIALLILIPLTSLFIGIRLSSASARPLPGLPADAPGSALMVFSAIPWMLAAGLLGPLATSALAGLAGLIHGAWNSYSFFSLLEFALIGA